MENLEPEELGPSSVFTLFLIPLLLPSLSLLLAGKEGALGPWEEGKAAWRR